MFSQKGNFTLAPFLICNFATVILPLNPVENNENENQQMTDELF